MTGALSSGAALAGATGAGLAYSAMAGEASRSAIARMKCFILWSSGEIEISPCAPLKAGETLFEIVVGRAQVVVHGLELLLSANQQRDHRILAPAVQRAVG